MPSICPHVDLSPHGSEPKFCIFCNDLHGSETHTGVIMLLHYLCIKCYRSSAQWENVVPKRHLFLILPLNIFNLFNILLLNLWEEKNVTGFYIKGLLVPNTLTIQKSIHSLLTVTETGKLPNNLKKFWIGLVVNTIMLKNFNIQSKYIYSCLYSPCPSASDTSPMSITSLRCLVQRL